MRFHLRRFKDAFQRTGDWCVLFGRRLRGALSSRYFLAPLFCVVSIWLYSRYITHLNLFVFIEQDRVTVIETYTQDAETALAEAGIHISRTDLVSLPQGLISGSAAEIQITRTNEVTVTLDGVTVPVVSLGGTVAAALDKAGYVPQPLDMISPPPETPITDGMAITVTRIQIFTRQEQEAIPFGTIEQDSQYVNAGASIVTTEGEEGERELTYEVILRDGKIISDRLILDEVVKEPVTEIIVHGTGGTITLADGTVRRYTQRLDVVCTAYSTERQVNKINAIGNIARPGTIAVDPKFIPLRIDVFITSRNGTWVYGLARTEDTGRLIKGYIIDLYIESHDECIQFGRRTGYLYILG
jgi:3D (Asp-Asp-Asp) domain-containing protein